MHIPTRLVNNLLKTGVTLNLITLSLNKVLPQGIDNMLLLTSHSCVDRFSHIHDSLFLVYSTTLAPAINPIY